MDKHSRGTDQSADDKNGNKSFRRLIVRFAEKTSMQGVPYINNAKLIAARIIWVMLLLGALAAMGLHLWYLVDQFSKFPFTAKVSFGFGNLRLPEVTICNTNPIHKSRLDKTDDFDELKRLIRDMSPENVAPEHFDDDLFYRKYSDFYSYVDGQYQFNASAVDGVDQDYADEYSGFDPSTYDPDYSYYLNDDREYDEYEYNGAIDNQGRLYEVFKSLFLNVERDSREYVGHQMNDMLLTCSFNGRVCNSSMFRLYQTSEYGNCYTLSNERFSVLKPGPSGALSLVLFLEASEYMSGITQGYGVQVEVHEPGTYPDPFESGFLVQAASETNIGMRMMKIERIDEPHSNCEPGKTFKAFYGRNYTRKSCQDLCRVTKELEACGCYDDYWEEIVSATKTTLKPCTTSTQWNCVLDIERQAEQKALVCKCLNPCQEITYNKEISSRQWPNEGYLKILQKQVCGRDLEACHKMRSNAEKIPIKYNFIKLNIFYESLNFENIKEEADIETAQFLSDVGGAVGLWIGLSILSLCELLQLFVELFDLAIHRCCSAGRMDRKTNKKDRYINNGDPSSARNKQGAKENANYPLEDPRGNNVNYHQHTLPRGEYRDSRKYGPGYGETGSYRIDRR